MAGLLGRMLDFTGKTAIITGGCAGMGVGLAKRFYETGVNVVVTYHNTPVDRLQTVLQGIGKDAFAVKVDFRNDECAQMLVRAAVQRFGSVDILVNNAGIYPPTEALSCTEEQWDAMQSSNLRAAFFTSQAAAKRMIAQESGGCIVNISSINATRPMQNGVAYSASKAGVEMMTRCMAAELGEYGIRVNAVAPGLMDAPGLDESVPGWRARYSARAPLGRIGLPTDIADACIFFCSEMSAWVTGQVLTVDGGVMLAAAY